MALAVGTGMALDATVCNCEESMHMELLQFDDITCDKEPSNKYEEVVYTLETTRPMPEIIVGWACSTWIRRKVVTTGWLGDVDFVISTIAKDTTYQQCKDLQKNVNCDGHPMVRTGDDKYTFNNQPVGGEMRGQTVTVDILNCGLQKVSVAHPCHDCDMETPIGTERPEKGFLSKSHVTIIWEAGKLHQETCTPRSLAVGSAFLTTDKLNKTQRLMDATKQLDYHVDYEETDYSCKKDRTTMGRSVVSHPEWYVKYEIVKNGHVNGVKLPGKELPSRRNDPAPLTPHSRAKRSDAMDQEKIDSRVQSHEQYMADKQLEVSNDLAKEIRWTQCEARKTRHAIAIATASINPWLAAKQLNLERCTRLIAAGEFVMAQKCSALKVTFQTEVTHCGPQLKFNNNSISPNGYELIRYTPCAITSDIVHVAGSAYRYDGVNWKPVHPKKILQQHELAHYFKYPEDNAMQYHLRNPAHQQAVDVITQYTNIALERFTYGDADGSSPVPGGFTDVFKKATSIWDTIIFWGIVVTTIILALIILRILQHFKIFDMIRSAIILILCCCFRARKQKKKTRIVKKKKKEDVPLQDMV